jgi:predicted MFS family arabinose efflux permease
MVAVHPQPVRRRTGVIVLCGCLIAMVTFGVRSSFGLFTEPLSVANGWEREVFALAIALQNVLWGLGQPFAGGLADRLGPARVLAGGALLYTAGTALMAVSTSPAALQLTAGLLVGLGLSGASFTIVITGFTRLVPEDRRAWAIGLATAAGSLGQFLFAPLGQAFLSTYGWATALMLLAGFVALVPVLAIALRGGGSRHAGDDNVPIGAALQQAFRHPSYGLLAAGFFVCGFHVAFITTHLPPYLSDLGLSPTLAAWSIGLVGLFNIIGSYSAGILGTRHSPRRLLSGIYLGRALAITLFVITPISTVTVLLFAAAMGLLWLSTVPLTSSLVALFFGTRHMGTLFGFVFLSHQIGAFIGVWLGGAIYTRTGSYEPMWWFSVALGILAAALHVPIVERRLPLLTPVPAV